MDWALSIVILWIVGKRHGTRLPDRLRDPHSAFEHVVRAGTAVT
jgi:hypothetical protein